MFYNVKTAVSKDLVKGNRPKQLLNSKTECGMLKQIVFKSPSFLRLNFIDIVGWTIVMNTV